MSNTSNDSQEEACSKPISNFHTHTYLCKHADGKPSDYVLQAQKDGCTALGFSDHCPYPINRPETWPHVRMSETEAPLYTKLVREAALMASQKDKAADNKNLPGKNFKVYLGFECEFDPCFESWYRDKLKGEFGADYLILGSHWIADGDDFAYIPEVTSQTIIHRYFDNTINGLKTGLFAFLAHPDLIMMGQRNWTADLQSCFSALIDAAVDCDIPLEINGLGLVRPLMIGDGKLRHPYPVDNFWQLAKEKGARIICNADAHSPDDVIKNARKARKYAEQFNLTPIENPLIK